MSTLIQPLVSQAEINARQGVISSVSDATVVSASTIDLTSISGYQIEVTGATDIDVITLQEGREVVLLCTGTGLNFIYSASLLLPGGVDAPVATSGWGIFLGGATSVVTCLRLQTATGYSRETFSNIFMNDDASIGFSEASSGVFGVGTASDPVGDGATPRLIFKNSSNAVAIARSDKTFLQGGAHLNIELLSLGVPRVFQFPDQGGVFAMISDLGANGGVIGTCDFDTTVGFTGGIGSWIDGIFNGGSATPLSTGAVEFVFSSAESDAHYVACVMQAAGGHTVTFQISGQSDTGFTLNCFRTASEDATDTTGTIAIMRLSV